VPDVVPAELDGIIISKLFAVKFGTVTDENFIYLPANNP
jgi:hypothetical protein